MEFFRRKPRPVKELLADPELLFYVGHLTGASEMIAHWLRLRENEEERQMGNRLYAASSWFFDRDSASQDTLILTPPRE